MRISLGADDRSNVVDAVIHWIKVQGHEVVYYGPRGKGSIPWPEVARCVGEDVAAGRSEEGILFCWTGTGVSIAANKIHGVRAALCTDAETARGARLWNNANVLCLSLRSLSEPVADEICQTWFDTHYISNPTDDACLKELAYIETGLTYPRRENPDCSRVE
jgi:ribose 5-phosphate isomerase B